MFLLVSLVSVAGLDGTIEPGENVPGRHDGGLRIFSFACCLLSRKGSCCYDSEGRRAMRDGLTARRGEECSTDVASRDLQRCDRVAGLPGAEMQEYEFLIISKLFALSFLLCSCPC